MTELSIEHILLFVVAAFLLYHLTSGCRCNGFRVGGRAAPSRFISDNDRQYLNYLDGDGEYNYLFKNGPSPLQVLKGESFRVGGQPTPVTNETVWKSDSIRCTAEHQYGDCDYGWVRQDCDNKGWCSIIPVPRAAVSDSDYTCPEDCDFCECVINSNDFPPIPKNCNKQCVSFKL